MIFAFKYSLIPFLLYMNQIVTIHGQGETLVQPEIIDSENGVLDITLTIEYGDYSQTGLTLTNTRLFNGALPGPTLRVSPGDTMNILFQNNLEEQDGAVTEGDNIFKLPDTSNLHFHGAHVSGELPSDDVRFNIGPEDEYQYSTTFPSNHMGGTHWIHPHVHGSSTLQIAGGAAASLIVRDDNEEDDLPSEVQDATEVLLMIQEMDPTTLNSARRDSGDDMLSIDDSSGLERWFIVNGQYQPEYAMTTNTWYRFRIIHAGFLGEPAGLEISGCDMQLLAKDGVYVQDFPRSVSSLPIPAGGRADVMVRCEDENTYTMTDYESRTVMTLEVSGGDGGASDLPDWTPDYPDYLVDLTTTDATDGCACETDIARCDGDDGFCINDEKFDEDLYIHTVPFGSVVERELSGIVRHPYHQHVYPFQIVEDINGISGDDADYWQVGDWHDVLQIESANGGVTVRYTADVHTGVIMLHCHILTHEDEGTMSQEFVGDSSFTTCECSAFTEEPTDETDDTTDDTSDDETDDNADDETDDNEDDETDDETDDNADDDTFTAPSFCFSSVATVVVESRGKVQVKDIQVGDRVLTASNDYKTVYTIDHKNPTKRTKFLQIYSNELSFPLEITDYHMVFVNDTKTPIPASKVKIGDKIRILNGATSTVTKISHVTRDGIWNPITTDGTIVVDGVIASTYSLAFGSETLQIFGFDLISHHDFTHLLMSPYRAMCLGVSLSLCESNHEFNAYSRLGKRLLEFTFEQNAVVQDLIIFCLLISFGLMFLAMKPLTVRFVFGAVCLYLARGERKPTRH